MFARRITNSRLATVRRADAPEPPVSNSVITPASSTVSSPPPVAASAAYFATLPSDVLESVASLLTVANCICLSSVDRATRRLLLSPHFWRQRVFIALPLLTCATRFPAWCDVVQLVEMRHSFETQWRPHSLSCLLLYPRLHHFHTSHFPRHPHSFMHIRRVLNSAQNSVSPPVSSGASMRHLTRISLHSGRALTVSELRLLTSLPVLASFAMEEMHFEEGNEETLAEWLEVSSKQQGTKRKVRDDEDADDSKTEVQQDARAGHPAASVGSSEPNLPLRYSSLLLFLHALAAKQSFVHLRLEQCHTTPHVMVNLVGIAPYVMDHMPVWPHLLCLSLAENDTLVTYPFTDVAARFPSLTSLTSPTGDSAAIEQLVRLPRLEELRFPKYVNSNRPDAESRTIDDCLRACSSAASLRSVQYTRPDAADRYQNVMPSLSALAALFTVGCITRLTFTAHWLRESSCVQLFTQHRFVHLRCLDLFSIYTRDWKAIPTGDVLHCPQTDAALLPLVKPADIVVEGREQRQAARAVKRRAPKPPAPSQLPFNNFTPGFKPGQIMAVTATSLPEKNYADDGEEAHHIPADGAVNFPALECLALPHSFYNRGDDSGKVSTWMRRQLRRSYEYEVAAEWEADQQTLGEAELVRSMA